MTKYLNEDKNIVDELENLLRHTDEIMFRFHFNRYGHFYFVRTESRKPLNFIKLKEKSRVNYEVVYVIGHEELWGQGLGTKALKRAMYNIFLLYRGQSITAYVHQENIRCINSLKKCWFKKTDETGEYIKYSITMSEYLSALKNR